jgi:large subunit ribosomal protein L14e
MFERGRICMKTAGREAGRFCVVIGKEKKEEKDFVLVTGPKIVTRVRRRKCNVRHLEPTPMKIQIKDNATDNEVMKAYEKSEIYKKLKIQKPTPEQIKLAEEAKERHRERAKEEKKEEKPKKEEKKPEKPKKEKKEPEHKKKEHREKRHKKPKPKKERKKKKEAKPKKAVKKKAKKKKK